MGRSSSPVRISPFQGEDAGSNPVRPINDFCVCDCNMLVLFCAICGSLPCPPLEICIAGRKHTGPPRTRQSRCFLANVGLHHRAGKVDAFPTGKTVLVKS